MSNQDIQRYEEMLASDPKSRAFAPLAEAYRKAGQLDKAIRVAERGVKYHPSYSGGLVVLARSLFEKGEAVKALEMIERAVREAPDNYLAQKTLGKVAMSLGENERALKALEAASFLSPEDGEITADITSLRGRLRSNLELKYEGKEEPEEKGFVVPEPSGDGEPSPLPGLTASEGIGAPEEEAPVEEIPPESLLPLGQESIGAGEDAEDMLDREDPSRPPVQPSVEVRPGFVDDLSEVTDEAEEAAEEVPLADQPGPGREGEEPAPPMGDLPPPPPAPVEPAPAPPVRPAQPAVEAEPESNPVPGQPAAVTEAAEAGGTTEGSPPVSREPLPGPSDEDLSTETLADLYARQGLTDQAARMYQQLLAARPEDADLAQKLAQLQGAEPQGGLAEPPPVVEATVAGPPGDGGPADPVEVLTGWLSNIERMKDK